MVYLNIILTNKGITMELNFILFKVYIEKYNKWSNYNYTRDNNEHIIDLGYLRFFIY
jgi:hypothetical protein